MDVLLKNERKLCIYEIDYIVIILVFGWVGKWLLEIFWIGYLGYLIS